MNGNQERLRHVTEFSMFGLLRMAAIINICALLGVYGYLVWNGYSVITWEFLAEPPRDSMTAGGDLAVHRGNRAAGFRGVAGFVSLGRGFSGLFA